MVYSNLTQREIAKKIEVREETLSRWKNQLEFQSLLKDNKASFMKDLIAPAMRGLKDLINADSEFVKLEAIKTILDRSGYDSLDDRGKELELEHTRIKIDKDKAQIDKTKAEISRIKGISEEVEDLSDIDGVIYGKD